MKFRCSNVRASDGALCVLKKEHVGKVPCRFEESRKPVESKENEDEKPASKFRTKAEALYAQYLEGLKLAGEIERYEYELFSLPVGVDCRYRFDFYVVVKRLFRSFDVPMVYREIQIHEVKAPHRHREKGIVKFRAAARQYPEFRFFLAMYDRGRWDIQEIKD